MGSAVAKFDHGGGCPCGLYRECLSGCEWNPKKTVPHEIRPHSELGASICHRWWNCPGSVKLSRGYPNRQTEDARKGTAAHEVAELCLRFHKNAEEYVGKKIDETAIEFTAEMAENVQFYLDDCRATPGGDGLTAVEVKFDLEVLGPPAPMFGTADFVAYRAASKKLYVKDYKNGYLHVPATSPQLKYYAIGAALWLGPTKPVTEVEVTIVQPNGSTEAVRRVTYTVPELVEWAKELVARAKLTQMPDAPLQAGAWCRFCPAAVDCPARASEALAVAQIEFADGVALSDTMPDEVRLMSGERKAEILTKAALLEGWLKDVRQSAFDDLKRDPNSVPGWKLVDKRPVRSWRDEQEAATAIRRLGADPYSTEVISPAQAEAAVAETLPGKTKKARTVAAKEALAGFVQSVSSGPTLAPEADPRPALPAAGSEFFALPAPTLTKEVTD